MAGRNQVRYNGHPAWDRLDPVEWPREFLDGARARAKQVEMLQIDVSHAARWVEVMQKLVDERLPDEEFTLRRMTALKEWEKSRHREQKALHYRYNPLARSKRLIVRDVERTLRSARAKLAKAKVLLEARREAAESALRVEEETSTQQANPSPRKSQPPASLPLETLPERAALHSGWSALDSGTRGMFQNLAPDVDIASTSDEDLERAWRERNPGMTDEPIGAVLGKINGVVDPG